MESWKRNLYVIWAAELAAIAGFSVVMPFLLAAAIVFVASGLSWLLGPARSPRPAPPPTDQLAHCLRGPSAWGQPPSQARASAAGYRLLLA